MVQVGARKSDIDIVDLLIPVLTNRFLVDNPSVDLDVDLIIYLKTSPDKAMERIKSRSR